MINNRTGLLITLILSISLVIFFYGKPLFNPGTTFFASAGDGLKDYFNTVYYIQYDTTSFHTQAMNYPHGEHIFFTGNQPSISMILRFVNHNVVGISDQMVVRILNLTMLLSIIAGVLFLYLLLTHLKLPVWYSILVALGITFLSPQLARMSGHFSLSYIFAIPAMLYLVALFHQKPRYWISILMGIFVLWAVGIHIYMLGFHASIILLYWIYVFVFFKGAVKTKENYWHLGLQFFLPLLVFISITLFTENVTDRTSYPMGFFYYKAVPEGIFLPLGKPYGQFIYYLSNFRYVTWEAYAYVGLIATLGFLFLVGLMFKNLYHRRFSVIGNPSENTILNIFFWSSFIMLLYAFGLPFIIGDLKHMVHILGPLKQMRGIARFSWLFFYVINIYIFYQIWHLKTKGIRKPIWIILLVVSITFLWYDAWLNVNFWSKQVNQSVPALVDFQNETEQNQWVQNLDISRYQATLPIPYFHIGSENFRISSPCNIESTTFIVSWKTGLPTMGVMLSRTSISQTIENLELFNQPYRRPDILDKLDPSQKLLIITRDDCAEIPETQKQLIQMSVPVYQSEELSFYELSYDSLVASLQNPYHQIAAEFDAEVLFSHQGYLSDHSDHNFLVPQLNEGEPYYFIPGNYADKFHKSQWAYIKDIPGLEAGQEYVFSFWIKGLRDDLVMRSRLLTETGDGNEWGFNKLNHELFQNTVAFDGDWALIERKFIMHERGTMIRWRFRNPDLRRYEFNISHMMIRPSHTNIYKKGDGWLMKNNWFYQP